MPYKLKKGHLAGMTRKQAFLIGILPSCALITVVMATTGAYMGGSLFRGIAFGAAVTAALGLVIWAVENNRRVALVSALMYAICAAYVLTTVGVGRVLVCLLIAWGAGVVVQFAMAFRQKVERDSQR